MTTIAAATDTDHVLLQSAQGTELIDTRIPLPQFRAYIAAALSLQLDAEGYLTTAEGTRLSTAPLTAPQLRASAIGIELSTDGGKSWTTLLPIAAIAPPAREQWLTQAEYDTLAAASQLDPQTTYNVYEE